MVTSTTSEATAHWSGSLFKGTGSTELTTSKVATLDTSWSKRVDAGAGTTSPEELLGAALATCYSMQLSAALGEAGHDPESIETRAAVTFSVDKGITGITLTVHADVPGMSPEDFREKARWAKDNCPVSQALKSVPKELRFE